MLPSGQRLNGFVLFEGSRVTSLKQNFWRNSWEGAPCVAQQVSQKPREPEVFEDVGKVGQCVHVTLYSSISVAGRPHAQSKWDS